MQVKVEGRKLIIKPGLFQSAVELNVDEINAWELFVDDLGNPYLYFIYNGLRQGISLPKNDVNAYKDRLLFIENVLKIAPKIEISAHQKLFDLGYGAVFSIDLFLLAVIASRS